ncbi:MAG: nitric oxide reductase subunit C [Candidatus Krumholzibacteriia bacterium]|jgi:nitric oxide reductase subunit C
MLSKSQARAFFIGGTAVFGLAFLGLTIDTIRQVPEQTNADDLTVEVVAGKEIWESNNCMGCHTLFGEGAYYAPELTKVVERRGKPWIRLFLKDPEAMFPGERKMVNYNFTETEIDEVIAFLDWCGKVDLNGFPADPPLKDIASPVVTTGVGGSAAPETFTSICVACHSVGGQGGNIGPALDDVRQRKNRTELVDWISDPQKIKPGTAMPQIPMEPAELDRVIDYLLSLSAPVADTPAGE